ncbi:hypothetical protein FNF27_02948 [Cafeteria roenbergensis]|uniref:CAP-Gly domain-containing protein n=1 Tax=Cafeteria roenbergensis TaxID=33653 RepID=A0A5A8EE55_CAFRO|nr:hypothetical protein FNF27_02948 [Cafeteria roenbergensis]
MAAADGADAASDIRIGDRVRDKSGNRATVRYLGPVATSKSADAVYVGVEWDAEGRGKNDGSVVTDAGETVRYFECEPGMGSFLKAKLVDRGVNLVSALEEKYVDSTQGGGEVIAESGEAVEVILVGEDEARRRQQLHRLWNVALLSKGVSRIDADTVASAAPSLVELDLSSNLLCRWTDIAALGAGAPKLRTLNLSGNAMSRPTPADAASLAATPLARLGVLVLSGCGVTMSDLLVLRPAAAFPALRELHLASNCIRGIEASEPGAAAAQPADKSAAPSAAEPTERETADQLAAALPRLETLNLSGNALTSWSHIWRLSRLPSLQRLILAGNALTEAAYGPSLAAAWPLPAEMPQEKAPEYSLRVATRLYPCETAAEAAPTPAAAAAAAAAAGSAAVAGGSPPSALPFASLTSLTLSDNPIASWDSVTALAAFPALTALRVSGAGVVGELGSNRARLEVVARLASVRTLNGSEVRPREREDAEKAYVRRVCHETAAAAEKPTFAEAVGVAADKLEELVTDVVAARATAPSGDAARRAPGSGADTAAATVSDGADAAAAVAAAHPRLFPLMLRHGEVAAAARDTGPKTMGSSTVSVTIRSMAGASSAMDPIAKRLPGSMTVLTLKQLAARAFKGDVAMCRLSFRDGKDAYPTPLDDDSKPLTYFGVCDGSEILLEEVDSAELVREAAEQEAAQAELMRREEERVTAMRRLKMEELRRNRSALAAAAAAAQAP